MPDFDIDFCQDRRDEVIRYVQERYGRDRVAQIITFGTLQARGVLRDVGRVLQMPYGQVDKLCKLVPQNPLNPGHARAGDRRRAAPAGGARQRSGGRARLRHRAKARRAAPPRLDPCRRHRDRRAAAHRDGAALSRSEIDDAGDPVQHEMGRAGGPGEVRLPRPQDAHRPADRGGARCASAASRSTWRRSRSTTRRPTPCWRAPRRWASSSWKVRACGARCSTCGRTASRTSSRWSRSTGPARWRTSRPTARASIGMEEPDYIHPKLEPVLRETFGVIVYQEQVMQAAQILAGYSLGEADLLRRAMGKKIRSEMQKQRSRFVVGLRRARHRTSAGRDDLRIARAFRRLRLQQEPRRRLCAGRLPDRLHEGELPGRVPRGVHDARHGQYRQAFRISRRGRAARHQGRAAVGQPLRRRLRRRGRTRSTTRSRRSKASAARRSRRSSRRAATGRSSILPISPRRINPRAVNKRVLESLAAAGAFDALDGNRARVFAAVDAHAGGRRSASTRPPRAERCNSPSAARPRARRDPPAGDRAMAAGRAAAEGVRRHRLLPHRPSARRLCRRAQAHAGAVLGRIRARGARGRERRPRRRYRGGAHGAAHAHRQQDGHHRAVRSDRALRGGRVLGRAGSNSATCSSPAPRCC